MLHFIHIVKGVEAKKYPTSELIRRKNAGLPLEDDEDKGALPRGKNSWPGEENIRTNSVEHWYIEHLRGQIQLFK